MTDLEQKIHEYIRLRNAGELGQEQLAALRELAVQHKEIFEEQFTQYMLENAQAETATGTETSWDARIQAVLDIDKTRQAQTPVHRIHLLKTAWFKYAAAILIIAGIGTYLWNTQQKEKLNGTTASAEALAKADVAPGGNKATLTLGDGRKIVLDSASNGTIANESGATITKRGNEVVYASRLTPHDSRLPAASMNTMSTPRGGQYRLTLPDGSQVWLNAASSITYPTSFAERERRVSVTGEVYFEVAKNKEKPFIVQTRTDEITVLGTHFNINAYEDEGNVKTSLLEGSVSVTADASRLTPHASRFLLHPGEAYENGKVTKTNVQQDVAWKNGAFSFNNTDIEVVLRQFARWYDIEVIYPAQKPNKKISGDIGRDLNLSEVLEGLNGLGVKTSIEGKKLYIR